jgi:hypothetical protein
LKRVSATAGKAMASPFPFPAAKVESQALSLVDLV